MKFVNETVRCGARAADLGAGVLQLRRRVERPRAFISEGRRVSGEGRL